MAEEIKQGLENNCYDRKSFPAEIPQHIWKQINIQKYGKKTCEHCCCLCGYRKMRNALLQTHGIILCNQDFLTSHLLNLRRGRDGLITCNAELVVIDEAHNLEEKVRSATTSRFSKSMIVTKIQEARIGHRRYRTTGNRTPTAFGTLGKNDHLQRIHLCPRSDRACQQLRL